MKTLIETLKEALELFVMKYNPKAKSDTAVMTEISAERNQIKTAELTV